MVVLDGVVVRERKVAGTAGVPAAVAKLNSFQK
jgi:hypothetical protein